MIAEIQSWLERRVPGFAFTVERDADLVLRLDYHVQSA